MTDFYDKGDYHVRGDRWDECPAFYGADIMEQWLWSSSFFIVIWSVIVSSILWNLDKLASQLWAMFGATYLVLCGITILWIWKNSGKCGMSIILYDRRDNILQRFYHFTNNPSYDAFKVAQIVRCFSLMADQKYLEDEAARISRSLKDEERKKKSEVCCTRYKEVIEKVKPE